MGKKKKNLIKKIKDYNLEDRIFLIGYKKNIFKYMYRSKCFKLTSLWEDPGFVLVEAAACRTSIISNDCPNGPKEFLQNSKAGYLFDIRNKNKNLMNTYMQFISEKKKDIKMKKIQAIKNAHLYSKYAHYKEFYKLITLNGHVVQW